MDELERIREVFGVEETAPAAPVADAPLIAPLQTQPTRENMALAAMKVLMAREALDNALGAMARYVAAAEGDQPPTPSA